METKIERIIEICLCLMAQGYAPKRLYIDLSLYETGREILVKNG